MPTSVADTVLDHTVHCLSRVADETSFVRCKSLFALLIANAKPPLVPAQWVEKVQ